ncbi:MAG: tetratricopeptide repeat protein [Candidatus Coatesbacteria bacterium]|nr:tetratricopeptide repeat protein [Candidatus Coatesbacteria bacterium]
MTILRITNPSQLIRIAGCLLFILLLSVDAHSRDEGSMYQFALRLYEDGEYQLAAKQLEQLMSNYPSGEFIADAVFLSGCAQDNLGNYAEAVKYLERYTVEFPGGERYCEAMVLLGTNRQRMGHYSTAETTFKELLSKKRCEKQFEDATARLAELLFIQDRYREAADYYEKLFPKGYSAQQDESLYEHYAQSLLANSQLKRAQDAFKTLSKKAKDDSTKANSSFNLAVALYLGGDFDKAEKLFASTLEEFPNSKQATAASLGIIWSAYGQKEFQRAASLMEKHQGLRGAEFQVAEKVIDACELATLGDYGKAISDMQDTLRDAESVNLETRLNILLLIAEWRRMRGEYSLEESVLKEMLPLDMGSELRYEVRYRQARNLVALKQLPAAEVLAKELIEDDPFGAHIHDCYLMLARISWMRMDFSEAIRRYKSLSLSFPDSPVAAESALECAEMLLDCAQPMDAIPLLNSVQATADLSSDFAERTQLAFCRAFYAIKAFENCDATAEKFQEDYPESRHLSEVLRLRGLSLQAIGSAQDALNYFRASHDAALRKAPERDAIFGTLLAYRSLDEQGKCASYIEETQKSYMLDERLKESLDFWSCYIRKERGNEKKAGECFAELAKKYQGRASSDYTALCLTEAYRSGFASGKPADAASYLENLVAEEPEWPFMALAEEGLRNALFQKGDYADSVTSIAEFRDHEPGAFLEIERSLREAEEAFNEGKLKKAARSLKKLVKSNPQNPQLYGARVLLARVYLASRKLGAAQDALMPILENQAAAPRVRQLSTALMGDIWYQRKKPRSAIEYYSKLNHPVLDDRHEEALLLYRIGEAHRQLGELDSAFDYYQQMVTDYQDQKGMCEELVSVGDNLRKMGRFQLARSALNLVISDEGCEPRFAVEARFWFAHTLQEQKRYDDAILKYLDLSYSFTQEEAVPWVASARANVGECYEARGDLDEAIRVYEKIIEKYPKSLWSQQAEARINRIKAIQSGKTPGATSE